MVQLETQVLKSRQKVKRDGYDMSIGELVSIYEKGELFIHPEYQRLFRWADDKKTGFIESLILNIPIPPIFVYTKDDGKWELIDGLQRVSTILQFVGALKDAEGKLVSPFTLAPTRLIPGLGDYVWDRKLSKNVGTSLPDKLKLDFRRQRLRVEILGPDSDASTKFELFKRLNTGGAPLQRQEVRNCIIVSMQPNLLADIRAITESKSFKLTTDLTTRQKSEQYDKELITRILVYQMYEFDGRKDLHDYLDDSVIDIGATDTDCTQVLKHIQRTMDLLASTMGDSAFRSYDGSNHSGGFSIALYEFIVLGLSEHIDAWVAAPKKALIDKIRKIRDLPKFKDYTGAGVRASTRLDKFVLPDAAKYFAL